MEKVIGKYEILEKIGEGGFGQVYKARHKELNVFRALKFPHDQSEKIESQLREAQLQAELEHENIIRIYDVEKIDGRFFIVMEYAGNGNLRDRLKSGEKLHLDEAIRFLIQICKGIAFAHEKNIAHYDIKPENILLTEDGKVKIADFGIARIVMESESEVSTILGTVRYMSPEHLDGKSDLRSDIWSLGIVFYEMITGIQCFDGYSTQEIIKNICTDNSIADRLVRSGIPDEAKDVVSKMLERDMDRRYGNAGEIVKDLEKISGKTTGIYKSTELRKRKKIGFRISIGIVILFIIAGMIYGKQAGILWKPGFVEEVSPSSAVSKLEVNKINMLCSKTGDFPHYIFIILVLFGIRIFIL